MTIGNKRPEAPANIMNLTPFIAGSRAAARRAGRILGGLLALALLWAVPQVSAAPQFDVFLGFDGNVREINWFPVVFEVLNDGPAFTGVIELSPGQFSGGQARRIQAEFPTNTRKRFVLPVFATSRGLSWNARLLDDRGKVRAEQPNLRAKRDVTSTSFLLAAVPRSFGGMPVFPELKKRPSEISPATAQFRPELFPDNPIALEGLDALYLNSEKALELKPPQTAALVRWVHQGGHLIVSIEQPGDVATLPWLRGLLPMEVSSVANLNVGNEIVQWMRSAQVNYLENQLEKNQSGSPNQGAQMSAAMRRRYGLNMPGQIPPQTPAPNEDNPWKELPESADWQAPETGVATGTLTDGHVELAAGHTPLIVTGQRDRGQVTLLLFNPEREPFRSWKLRPWLWARIAQVPQELLRDVDTRNYYGGWSIDGVLGSMIDSKQVHKLPISWLLLMLAVYLVVIGPVDRIVLQKMNKQIWTWVTFPVYVVAFSLLIYYISYKLRAGESELNHLHFVDIYPNQGKAEMRGRTYTSIYSPANAQFPFVSEQAFASIRGESLGPYSGGMEGTKVEVEQYGNNFKAKVHVPVWTSQLFVQDWWQSGPLPLAASVSHANNKRSLTVTNYTARPLDQARLVYGDKVYTLGTIKASQAITFDLGSLPFVPLAEFAIQNGSQNFQQAVNERRQAFQQNSGRIEWNLPLSAMAVSLLRASPHANNPNNYGANFLAPSGLDLTSLAHNGQALLMAWDAGQTLTRPTEQFKPLRFRQDTLLRLAIPVPNPL